jgi:feruloyl esterase
MQRPLCPFPKAARYNGAGDTNVAANFSCVDATGGNDQVPAPEYLN